MSLEDLDSILNKEAVIYTYSASHLSQRPEEAETIYKTYALTHIPLGDTTKYLEIIFNWIGGCNKGAFVGAVSGDYGHGKTSFMLHIWDASTTRKIFAVPPFSWEKVTDMIDGVAAWIKYILGKTHPELAFKAWKIYETHKEQTLQELAGKVATETGRDIDDVIRMLKTAEQKGGIIDTQPSVDRFLDYCEAVTGILKEAGYIGLLVLLDEPEVAAKKIGNNKVAGILFDIANGVPSRYGDYGVFISMPNNFLAQVQASFASLPARLESRQCFPRLGDLYGDDFAENLWSRYMEAFGLTAVSNEIILPVTLTAIGQVASSTRNDLSYGPRTVVSAFKRIVHCYKQNHRPHTPVDFVRDCIEGEILVSNYAVRVRESIGSPETEGIDKTLLLDVAAFPNGLPLETASKLGIAQDKLAELLRRSGLVYKHGNVIGLRGLQKTADIATTDQLKETIADIFGEFSITPETLGSAVSAFINSVIPRLFEKRQGQQLLGWDIPDLWRETQDKTRYAELVGAFRETVRDYPKRTVTVAVGPLEADPQKVYSEVLSPDSNSDILIHFRIRWNKEDPMPEKRIEIDPGDAGSRPSVVGFVLNFADTPLTNELLEEIIERDLLTPLSVLYLINEKSSRTLQKDYEALWQAKQEQLVRELLNRFFGDQVVRTQAAEQIGQSIAGDALALLGSICRAILLRRYPNYSTLISQPQWERKVNEYIGALKNADIPMAGMP